MSEEKILDLKETGAGEPNDHWYFIHKARMILQSIERQTQMYSPVVDVGSGSGFFAQQLKKRFSSEDITCVDPNYKVEQVGVHNGIKYQIDPPLCGGNLYLFIDVLEHVKEPEKLLTQYAQNSKPGAIFILTVPAFMSLWSSHDIYLGHFKRYTLSELESLAATCKMEVLESRYLFAPIFPLVYIYRRLLRNREPSSDLKAGTPLINFLLGFLLKMDLVLSCNRLCGTSALVVGRLLEE
jgi:SAM-dependent methyltransferase